MKILKKKINIAIRILKKIAKKEDIFIVRQSQKKWDEQFSCGKWDFLLANQPNVFLIAGMCSNIEHRGPISVLDVGCGNGALAGALAHFNQEYDYLGIDFSYSAVEKAEFKFPSYKFITIDAENPLVLDKKFDVIVFSEILYYVDYKRTLALYKNYLKNDGVYIISMYSSWRTNIIWQRINCMLNTLSFLEILDKKQNQYWKIKICQLE